MSLITDKAVEKGLELLDTASALATNEGPKVLSEYLNLMTFDAAMGLTPIILVAVIVFYGNKLISFGLKANETEIKDLQTAREAEKEKKHSVGMWNESRNRLSQAIQTEFNLKTYRFLLTSAALIISLWLGYDNVKRIGKIIIAPRVFLIQEGASLLKKGEAPKQ